VEKLQSSYRDRFKLLDGERAPLDKPFEPPNRHSVQSTLDFAKLRRPILHKLGTPLNEGFFLEHNMGPGKNREHVPPKGVIPGWSKAYENASAGFQQRIHGLKNSFRIRKVFERVNGHDDFHGTCRTGNELASGRDARVLCLLSRMMQPLLRDVEAKYPLSSQ
jgi:hypothetical protein